MRRFAIAFGHTVHSFGTRPVYKRTHSPEFVVLFSFEDQPGEWT